MNVIKKIGEKIIPDFIEDDFISAIETNFNRSKYYLRKEIQISRISQSDENELGYDGVLTTIVPFYIQFKRSYFYTPFFSGKLNKDRTTIKLPTDKGFYALELLRKHKKYDQHNAMYKLSQVAKAAYVAPLFHKSQVLDRIKSSGPEYIPNYYTPITFFDFTQNTRHIFNHVRTLKNAVSIIPHREITDKKPSHHYSYCRDLKMGFHSDPEIVDDLNINSLYNFMSQIIESNKIENVESYVSEIFNELNSILNLKDEMSEFNDIINASIDRISTNSNQIDYVDVKDELTTLDKLSILDDVLYQYFGIRQFIKYENKNSNL